VGLVENSHAYWKAIASGAVSLTISLAGISTGEKIPPTWVFAQTRKGNKDCEIYVSPFTASAALLKVLRRWSG